MKCLLLMVNHDEPDIIGLMFLKTAVNHRVFPMWFPTFFHSCHFAVTMPGIWYVQRLLQLFLFEPAVCKKK